MSVQQPVANNETFSRRISLAVEACRLHRLDVDHIDLYHQHRIDPDTPIEETVGALADLVQQDKIARNLALADRVGEIAQEKGCTPSQLALAGVQLTASDLQRIEEAAPRGAAAGRRYGEMGMGLLDH